MSSFIFISFAGISTSGQAFLVLRVLIISLTFFVYWNRLETKRGNIFWFHNVFDICYARIILILKWCFFYWILDVSCFSYITLILYYVELWQSLHPRVLTHFFQLEIYFWLVLTLLPKSGLTVFQNFLLSVISDRIMFWKCTLLAFLTILMKLLRCFL